MFLWWTQWNRLWRFLWILIGVFVGLVAGKAWASWRIEAQKLILYHDSRVMVAEGQVIISGEDLTVFASRARYHLETKRLYLWGPVKILTAHGDWLKGRRAFMDLRSGEGEIEGAHLFLKKDRVQVKARKMKQIGERKYVAYQAVISTCELTCEESPPWSFRARKVEISQGRARGRGVSFWVKKLPLGYSPYVTLAVKRERKSGVLWPRLVSGSRTGLGLETPLFLALHDSFDFTLYPLYTGKRGLLWGLEGRFRLRKESRGIFRYRYLHDRLQDDDYNQDGVIRTNRSRYWLVAKWDQRLSSRTDFHLDLDLLSDRDFLEEFDGGDLGFSESRRSYLSWFGRGLEEKNQTYRTSRIWLAHRRDNTYFELSSTYHDAVPPRDQKTTQSPLGKFFFFPVSYPLWGPLTFEGPLEITYWHREEGVKGWRADASPALTLNFPLGPFENALTYRLRHTFYSVDQNPGPKEEHTRTLHELSAHTSFEAYRVHSTTRGGLSGLRHSLRPYLSYFYRSSEDQDDLPVFTSEDRLPEAQYLEYGLLQFLTAKKRKGNELKYWDLARFKLFQRYDFKKSSKKFSPLLAELEIRTLSRFTLRYDAVYHFYGLGLTKQELSLSIKKWLLDTLSLGYQRDKVRRIQQLHLSGRKTLRKKYVLHGRFSRNLLRSENSYVEAGLTYQGSCFSVDFTFSRTPEDFRFSVWINLLGLGGYGKVFRPP